MKWGIDFMHCKPTSVGGHGYIIVAMDYFTKWDETMPTYVEDRKIVSLFIFNHIITRFIVPQANVTHHVSHFQNKMISELSSKLGFHHDNSTPYYLKANGQVEAINKLLKTMLQRMVWQAKSSWHLQMFFTLWDYRTTIIIYTSFTLFQLVYGLEATVPIDCEIPSLKLVVELLPNTTLEEERFLYLNKMDETH